MMTNREVFKIYNALAAISQLPALPFDVAYGVARNLKNLRTWMDNYMDARKAAVDAMKCRCVQLNLMAREDYDKLSEDNRKAFDKAFIDIELEAATVPAWYVLGLDKFDNRADGRVIEVAAQWLEPLLETVIV